jgi:FkbM family methyltransferase
MKHLRKLLIFFFGIIDQFFHQKRIKRFIKSQKIKIRTFIDVGSFEGNYTDLILEIEKNCKIIMIEPQDKYYSLIKEKYKNNNQVEVIQLGLSDKKDKLILKINKHEITSTFSEFKSTNKYLNLKAVLFESNLENMTTKNQEIKVMPLDDLINEKNINFVDLIKIDTEGHEYKVLNGSQKCLKKINFILIEFHTDKIYKNYKPEEIHQLLIDNNFIFLKKFRFPFTTWEDRIYKNSDYKG